MVLGEVVEEFVDDGGSGGRPVLQVLLQRSPDGVRLPVDEILDESGFVQDRVQEGVDGIFLQDPPPHPDGRIRVIIARLTGQVETGCR
ncbi:hypothetical protein Psi02_64380 [Planotetraspora silvatica]|uniref:Uncharacterized protein n=1 Tax=Planotetraspora silvatica TaxID=234614 RepID=A0A8J3XR43_9ACTN|nr:hypothetical protein [Planotetraspora silvatica]GII50014.1 hypothetical protein Psi02_64380 [Planotetraspora silvatica]